MYELAGIVGMDPQRHTLRQLLWSAKQKLSTDWDHTADLMALLANVHRNKRGRAFHRGDFHPFKKKRGAIPLTKRALMSIGSQFQTVKVAASEIKVGPPPERSKRDGHDFR